MDRHLSFDQKCSLIMEVKILVCGKLMTSDPSRTEFTTIVIDGTSLAIAGLEVAMKFVVFLSAVILLHQVCNASEYQKWTAQSQSDSC